MEEVIKILKEIGIPFAYDHFAEGESPSPPFICYLTPGTDNFAADGIAYLKVNEINIELYTDFKDLSVERKVESVLDKFGIFTTRNLKHGLIVKSYLKSYIHLKWRLKIYG